MAEKPDGYHYHGTLFPRECEVDTGIPNSEQQRWEEEPTASDGENQWGFSLPGDCHSYYCSTSVGSALPILTAGGPLCRAHPSSGFWNALFLGRLLAEIQAVTKLCGFGKRAGLPDLKPTGSTPPPTC